MSIPVMFPARSPGTVPRHQSDDEGHISISDSLQLLILTPFSHGRQKACVQLSGCLLVASRYYRLF
jgi:hypothetical protein